MSEPTVTVTQLKPAKTRIYKILHPGGVSLVRATHVNHAIRYIADQSITGSLATQDDLVQYAAVLYIEDAAGETEPPPSRQPDLIHAIKERSHD